MSSLSPDDAPAASTPAARRTASHRRPRRRSPLWRHGAVVAAGVAALASGALYAASDHADPAAASSRVAPPAAPGASSRPSKAPSTTPSTMPPTTVAPLQVTPSSPAPGSTGVDGTAAVTIATSRPDDVTGPLPSLSPATPGSWAAQGNRLVFTPSGAFPPDTVVHVDVPAGLRGVGGPTLGRARAFSFRTSGGSVLALQEDLAGLGYLPLSFVPASPPDSSPAGLEKAVYHPPAGRFVWKWSQVPPTLAAAWNPGQDTVMLRGAVMAFEADHGLTVDGVAGPQVWDALLSHPAANTGGYTYALASKATPETLTVWHDGQVLSTSRANTGIPQAPTADGTFPVYERLATQVMRGTNPDGTRYADPVAWVAYFNGGDAIHYMGRSSYGSPQSLGCVEVPYDVGRTIWPYLKLGTLVTVAG